METKEIIRWIRTEITNSKDFIKRNQGHCSSCVQYCNEEQGKIDVLKKLMEERLSNEHL